MKNVPYMFLVTQNTFVNSNIDGQSDISFNVTENAFINSNINNANAYYNWYGSNATQIVPYLELHVDQVKTLVSGEWLGALNIYFVKNGTNERVNVPWVRNANLSIINGNGKVQNTTTGKHGKIYTNNTEGQLTVKIQVDDYSQEFKSRRQIIRSSKVITKNKIRYGNVARNRYMSWCRKLFKTFIFKTARNPPNNINRLFSF